MGISAKPTGKMESILRKIDNEKEKEQKLRNKAKAPKEKKES